VTGNDRRQVGAEAAALLKAAKDVVVVLGQFEPDRAKQIFPVIHGQAMTTGDTANDLIDQVEVVDKELLVIHLGEADAALSKPPPSKASREREKSRLSAQ
jgi:hypothetical protein